MVDPDSPTEEFPMLERQLEAQFRKRVKEMLGGVIIKLAPTEAGIPDRLVILPGNRMYLVELKTQTGRLSPIQMHWHRKVGDLGVSVTTIYGLADIVKWVKDRVNEVSPDFVEETVGRRRPARAPRGFQWMVTSGVGSQNKHLVATVLKETQEEGESVCERYRGLWHWSSNNKRQCPICSSRIYLLEDAA